MVMVLRAMNSALGNCGGEVGIGKLTTGEAGSKGSGVKAILAPKDPNGLFRTYGVDAGAAGMDAVDKISPVSGSAYGKTISCCVVPPRG
jgi:hypothetical protein